MKIYFIDDWKTPEMFKLNDPNIIKFKTIKTSTVFGTTITEEPYILYLDYDFDIVGETNTGLDLLKLLCLIRKPSHLYSISLLHSDKFKVYCSEHAIPFTDYITNINGYIIQTKVDGQSG